MAADPGQYGGRADRGPYGSRMAAYIGTIFLVTMVLTRLLMDLLFTAMELVPTTHHNIRAEVTHFSLNYAFWLNLIFGPPTMTMTMTMTMIMLAPRHPTQPNHAHMHHDQHDMYDREEWP